MYKHRLSIIKDEYLAGKLSVHDLLNRLTALADSVIKPTAQKYQMKEADLCLVALSGYARGQLFPYSDIDLLILHRGGLCEEDIECINEFTAALVKADIDSDIHTIDIEIMQRTAADTLFTDYIDNLFLGGSRNIYDEFTTILQKQINTVGRTKYLDAKFQEIANRTAIYNDSLYKLEPNIKDGKGGLSDINAVWWIVEIYYNIPHIAELKTAPFFTGGSYTDFKHAMDFIFQVRVELRYLTDKKTDLLSREYQPIIAERLHFTTSDKDSGVENFMREYYRSAYIISETVTKAMSIIKSRTTGVNSTKGKRLPGGLILYDNALLLQNKHAKDLKHIMRLLKYSVQTNIPIHQSMKDVFRNTKFSRKEIKSTGHMIGDFLSQFGSSAQYAHKLVMLNLMEKYIPEFSDIMYRIQDINFHKFTVDEHTFLTLKSLDAIALKHDKYVNHFFDTLIEVPRKDILGLAALLHDIGKSTHEDHSKAGALMTKIILERMGYGKQDIAAVSSLVGKHLLMRHTSQGCDLSSREVITDFISRLASPMELDMLYLLTYADMNAMSGTEPEPQNISLLTELYRRAKAYFVFSGRPVQIAECLPVKKQALAVQINKQHMNDRILPLIDDQMMYAFTLEKLVMCASMFDEQWKTGKASVRISQRQGDTILLAVCADSCIGLLRRLSGALYKAGCDMTNALIYTNAAKITINAIEFIGPADPITSVYIADAVNSNNPEPTVDRQLHKTPAETIRVNFDNKAYSKYTIVDIRTDNRPGLLYDISDVFTGHGITVHHARISAAEGVMSAAFAVTASSHVKISGEELTLLENDITMMINGGSDEPYRN